MTDFDYAVREQKRIANSARKRKCGIKSKRCSLPSDHLTAKEWRAKCGKMVSYRMDSPMNYATFKELADVTRKAYMESLRDEYGATAVDIAALLGVSAVTVRRIAATLSVVFRPGQHMSKEQRKRWDAFLSGKESSACAEADAFARENDCAENTSCMPSGTAASARLDVLSPGLLPPDEAVGETQTEPTKNQMALSRFTMRFGGEINVPMIANSLRYVLGEDSVGTVEIVCDLVNQPSL